MSGYDDLIASEMSSNPVLNRLLESATVDANRKPITDADLRAGSLAGPTVRFWSKCDDCNVMLTDGDLCGHCERKHVRRVVERHGLHDSAGVCGPCATEAGLSAARGGGDVGHLYDDVLRRKAGLPVTCEPEKAGALDVEHCAEPVRPALPVTLSIDEWLRSGGYSNGPAFAINEADLEYREPLLNEIQRDIAASMVRHPAGSKLTDQSEWAVGRMPAGPPVIGPEESLSDMGMTVHRYTPGDDDDDTVATIRAVRATIGYLMRHITRGPASAALLLAFDRRLAQLEAAELAKGGQQ